MKKLPDKKGITQAVLAELESINRNSWKEFTIDQIISYWWKSRRSGKSLELSDSGKNAFDLANLEKTTINEQFETYNAKELVLKNLIKLPCPYIINHALSRHLLLSVDLYDTRIGSLIVLHGSFTEYFKK